MDKLEIVNKAVKKSQDVAYTESTLGYSHIIEALHKEMEAAREVAESELFANKVSENSASYFEHFGTMKGLKWLERYVKQVQIKGEQAKKDLEKWQSTKNPLTSKDK